MKTFLFTVIGALLCASVFADSKDQQALDVLFRIVEKNVVSAAEAMPADKYSFAPTQGEFKGVRIFAEQVKHAAATNYILAAAALGEDPPKDAGDEQGPDSIHTKAEIVAYLKGSFVQLHKALERMNEQPQNVRTSLISPLQAANATRVALVVESLLHAYDHYGQMVEYLRMNGVIPPASRN
jgi:DinB family protein